MSAPGVSDADITSDIYATALLRPSAGSVRGEWSMRKVYIATKYENKAAAEELSVKLFHEAHMQSTSSWHLYAGTDENSDYRRLRCADQDMRDVEAADEFVLLWHPGIQGALVELGMALQLRKFITLIDFPEGGTVFFYHEFVKRMTLSEYLDSKIPRQERG